MAKAKKIKKTIPDPIKGSKDLIGPLVTLLSQSLGNLDETIHDKRFKKHANRAMLALINIEYLITPPSCSAEIVPYEQRV